MDGLECNELSLNDLMINNNVFRFDAEYFNKKAIKVIDNICKGPFKYLGEIFDISKLAGFEFTKYFTEQNMNSSDSSIALTSKNIQKEKLSLGEYITIDNACAQRYLTRSKLHKNDVVLSYTGEYRRALTVRTDDYQLGPNVCRLTPIDSQTFSLYYSAFLNSKTGQIILDKEKTLSAQPTVAMQRIRKIPCPIPNETLLDEIKRAGNEYYSLLDSAEKLISEAQKILDSDIEDGVSIDSDNVSIIGVKEVLNNCRFDSEYYLKKYKEVREKIKRYKKGYKSFFDACEISDKTFILEDTKTYKYIELSNVEKNGIIGGCTIETGDNLPSRARRLIRKDDVILSSIEGSLDSIALVTDEYDTSICSTGFYVVKSKYINPETLTLLFKNKYIQMILKQECSGTILTNVTKDNLAKVVLPIINDEIQKLVSSRIKQALNEYKKANDIYANIISKIDSLYFDI